MIGGIGKLVGGLLGGKGKGGGGLLGGILGKIKSLASKLKGSLTPLLRRTLAAATMRHGRAVKKFFAGN